jgi:hypothetical protein
MTEFDYNRSKSQTGSTVLSHQDQLEHEQVQKIIVENPFASTIASAADLRPSIFLDKPKVQEQDLDIEIETKEKEKARAHQKLLKRLLKIREPFKVYVQQVLGHIKDFLTSAKSLEESASLNKKLNLDSDKSLEKRSMSKSVKTDNPTTKMIQKEVESGKEISTTSFEEKKIIELESQLEILSEELDNLNSDNVNKLMDLMARIMIIAGTMGIRHSRLESHRSLDSSAKTAEEKKVAYSGGRGYSYAQFGLQLGATLFSALGFAGNFLGKTTVATVFTGLDKTSTAVSALGTGVGKIGENKELDRQAKLTMFELKNTELNEGRRNLSGSLDGLIQKIEGLIAKMREAQQAKSQALRSAIGA